MPARIRSFVAFLLGILLLSTGPSLSATSSPFVINVILPLTGGVAAFGGEILDAFRVYESLANQQGGINGQPIHFDVHDDQSSPVVAVQLFSQIVASSHPAVILGATPTPTCNALAPLAKDGPLLFCATPGYIGTPGFVFGASMGLFPFDRGMIGYFRQRGFQRLAVISSTDAVGQANDEITRQVLALPENRDLKAVAWEHFNNGDLNVSAQVQHIRASGAQAIVAWVTGTGYGTLLRNLNDAGVDLPITSTGAGLTEAVLSQYASFIPSDLAVPAAAFMALSQVEGTPLQKPVAELYAAYKAAGKTVTPQGPSFSWDFCHMLIAAFKKYGTNATAQQLRDYILAIHGYAGIDGVYDFRIGDQHGLSSSNVVMIRWDPNSKTFTPASRLGGAPLRK